MVSKDNGIASRLYRAGAVALSDSELLSVLLSAGKPDEATLRRSKECLSNLGGIGIVPAASRGMLRAAGLGEPESSVALCLSEVACRMAKAKLAKYVRFKEPIDVVHYLKLRYGQIGQEVLGGLFLTSRNRLIADRELYRGTLSRIDAEPREVLRQSLILGAARVVLFHNHPSGDPTPSPGDRAFTVRLRRAAEMMGVDLFDHFILGAGGRWTSLRLIMKW